MQDKKVRPPELQKAETLHAPQIKKLQKTIVYIHGVNQ